MKQENTEQKHKNQNSSVILAIVTGIVVPLIAAFIGLIPYLFPDIREWFHKTVSASDHVSSAVEETNSIGERYQNNLCGFSNNTVPCLCTSDGENLYYTDFQKIYRCDRKKSKDSVVKLSGRATLTLYYYNDYLYFNDLVEEQFYRLSCVESDVEPQMVFEKDAVDVNFIGDWIVFRDTKDYFAYQMKLDGSEKKRLIDQPVQFLFCDGSQMLFLDYNEGTYCSTDMDGQNRTVICDKAIVSWPNVVDDWIYFVNENDRFVYKMRKDGSSIRQLNEFHVKTMNYYENKLYMTGINGGIYSMNTDGSDFKLLKDETVYGNTSIVDGVIYYINASADISTLEILS